MDNQNERYDPVGEKYFSAVRTADTWVDRLFLVSAGLSIIVLYGERLPAIHDFLRISFAISVIALFSLSLAIRLYWLPRAEDKRRQDFLSTAFGVHLSHDETIGYYNNEQTNSYKRVAAQLLENSFFSKAIVLRMARRERFTSAIYVLVWITTVFARGTSLDLLVVAIQVVFSEQILSRWLRVEWLRMRFEAIYAATYRLFQGRASGAAFGAQATDLYSEYETTKAVGAITLSSTIFDRLNPTLSSEWTQVKKALQIQ